jgi:hypothetical protein
MPRWLVVLYVSDNRVRVTLGRPVCHPCFPILQVLLRELLIASEDKMSVMAGPEFVYIIASLAKLRASPDTPWINRWLAMSRHR